MLFLLLHTFFCCPKRCFILSLSPFFFSFWVRLYADGEDALLQRRRKKKREQRLFPSITASPRVSLLLSPSPSLFFLLPQLMIIHPTPPLPPTLRGREREREATFQGGAQCEPQRISCLCVKKSPICSPLNVFYSYFFGGSHCAQKETQVASAAHSPFPFPSSEASFLSPFLKGGGGKESGGRRCSRRRRGRVKNEGAK